MTSDRNVVGDVRRGREFYLLRGAGWNDLEGRAPLDEWPILQESTAGPRAGRVRHSKSSSGRAHRTRLSEQRLEIHVGSFGFVELEKLRLPESELAGDDHVGELLDAHVVLVDAGVVRLAPVGNLVL